MRWSAWEPYNTAVLEQVPASYVVPRGGGHLSYVMVVTAHEPTIKDSPQLVRNVIAGLAAASQYTRKNRDEAIEIFARWVPSTDPALPRRQCSTSAMIRAFTRRHNGLQSGRRDVLKNTLQGAARLSIGDQFAPVFLAEVQKASTTCRRCSAAVDPDFGNGRKRMVGKWTRRAGTAEVPKRPKSANRHW